MARSPQGRSAAGEEAARTLSEASSAGSGSGGGSALGSGSGSGGSSATNTAAPAPATLPDVTYGKILNVPDNLLGAGFTGKGWTIDEAVMEGGKPVIKLHRRVGNTGRIEEHKIDGETFARAKAYREKQTGMAKNVKPLVLKKTELGRPLDPEGDITPDAYDAGSKSYRVKLPGSREPKWISEDVIREFKQGREGALQELRKAAGLEDAATATTAGQVVAGIARSFGLGNKNKEKAPDRPSTSGSPPQSATAQTREANRAANNQPEDRAAQERQNRDQHLRRLNRQRAEQNEDEGGDQPTPDRGAVAYNVTNKPGESSKVEVDASTSGAQAFSTTASTSKRRTTGGTRLTIDETTDAQATEITNKPDNAEQTNVSDTSQNPQASYQTINRPLSAAIPGAASSLPSSETTEANGTPQPDRVQEAGQRSEARRQRRQGAREKTTLRGAVPSSEFSISSSSVGGGSAPQSLGTIEITETEAAPEIRQMRELMRAQAQDRNINITSRVNATVPSFQGGSGFSLPTSSSGSSGSVRGGGASSVVGALAPALAAAGAGAGQLMGMAGSRASTLQAARGAAQAIVNTEGTQREEALQRIQSSLEVVDLQIQVTSKQLLQPPSSTSGSSSTPSPRSPSPVNQLSSLEATAPANSVRQVHVTQTSSTPQDLSLLQQSAGTLRQAQDGVSALPAGSVVPRGFSNTIAGLAPLISAVAQQVPQTTTGGEEAEALQRFASSFSPRPELSPAQPATPGMEAGAPSSSSGSSSQAPSVSASAQPAAAPTQGVRVGAPPVPRRRAASPSSSGVGAQHVGGRGPLSAPLASAVNLNAAQARDQGAGSQAGGQDARTDALSQDSSMPTDTNAQAPVTPRSAGFSPSSSSSDQEGAEGAEDMLSTPAEEAKKMREDADKTRATGEQFSGGQAGNEPDGDQSPAEEPTEPPPATTGLSPEQQLTAALQIGAAKQEKEQQEKEAGDEPSRAPSSSPAGGREKSFQERLTKGKLLMDLIEGCFDAVGFLQFLAESTIGIINDKYFKLNSLPTLKGVLGGPEDRVDRALRRGVIFVDIYLFIVLFMGACVVVALIVAIVGGVGGVGGAAGTATPAAPGANPGIISWGLDS